MMNKNTATKRIAAGFYEFNHNGFTVGIVKVEDKPFWYFTVAKEGADKPSISGQDWVNSKADAITSAKHVLDNLALYGLDSDGRPVSGI